MVRFRSSNMMRHIFIIYLVALCLVKCLAMSNSELQDFKNFLEKTSALDQTLKDGFNSEEDDDEHVSDHAWEESGKFEGDLILSDRQRKIIVADVAEGLSRNGLNDITKRWPNNEVIYYIQREHFSGSQVQAIQDGIDDLGRASCITFRPYKKGDRDAVVIQGSRRGCFSQVGYQGGYQVLNLSGRHPVGRGCFRHGTVVHELLHTLGFYHMQSSPDRDEHIDVVWENIVEPAKHNFRKYNSFAVTDFGVGYDYDSVLHYSRRAFSINGKDTLVPKQSGAEIGQRIGLSDKDTQKLNKMYCDKDSNNFEQSEEIATQRPVKKKTSRNKPFQGHGIGYHKGKTVVIKLPAAETYKLPDLPSYHIFDYFSKTPETLSMGYPEAFSKEVDREFPFKETFKKINIESKAIEKQNDKDTSSDDIVTEKEEHIKETIKHNDKNENIPKHDIQKVKTVNEKPLQSESALDDSLKDAFERLRKIIKTHVYPTRGVEFNLYDGDDRTSFQKEDSSVAQKQKRPDTSIFPPILSTGSSIFIDDKTESTPFIHDFKIPHFNENSESSNESRKPLSYSPYIHDVEIPQSTENSRSDDHEDNNSKSYYSNDYITKKPQPYLTYTHDDDNSQSTETSKSDEEDTSINYYSDVYKPKKSQPYLNYENGSNEKFSSKYIYPFNKRHSDYLSNREYDSFGEYHNIPQKRKENPFKGYYTGSYGLYKYVPKTWLSE